MKTNDRRIGDGSRGAAALAVLCLFGTSGCGGFFYALESGSASSKVETAQTMGAEKYAPYEYYYARAHLEKGMEMAAVGEYGHAIHFASTANESAQKAIELSRKARGGAGR